MGSQTLKQFLKTQNPETMIYVGTKDGSGWIVIEPMVILTMQLKAIDTMMYDKTTKHLALLNKKLTSFESSLDRNGYDIQSVIGDQNSYEYYKYLMDARKSLLSQIDGCTKRINTLERFLKKDYKLSSRKVIEVYDHKDDIPGVCVLVEGSELGDMWFKGESSQMEFTKRCDYETEND